VLTTLVIMLLGEVFSFSTKRRTLKSPSLSPLRTFRSYQHHKPQRWCITLLFSARTDAILEQLKSITLIEAAELVKQIEQAFGVDASISAAPAAPESAVSEEPTEKPPQTEFDVVLESVDTLKRIAMIKFLRTVDTTLSLKDAKDVIDALPKTIKEKLGKVEAHDLQKSLEENGGRVTVK